MSEKQRVIIQPHAEAIIGVTERSPPWNVHTYPATVEAEPNEDLDFLEVMYFPEKGFGIALWYDTTTERVRKKELMRNPNPLTLLIRRFQYPGYGNVGF